MAQQLRVPAAPSQDLDLTSTYMVVHNHLLTPVSEEKTPSVLCEYQARMHYTERHTGKTLVHIE